ncbi:UNKNOWN [Stylonychia lemnae]|uniref:EF-hand domain-containing protein n=1 Tax=Stylonychia lemnae TaxID=5949 RepID=A0A078ABB7_STYLE|nr:UNKNOWN [Stylonychia lemnae]|eukprot:CDW78083.1 UNKNOWN [Stylonychia lemnae]
MSNSNSTSININISNNQQNNNSTSVNDDNIIKSSLSRNNKNIMQNLSEMIEEQKVYNQIQQNTKRIQNNFKQQLNSIQSQQDSKSVHSPQVMNRTAKLQEITLMKDDRYPQYQKYKEQQQMIDNKYKEFFFVNKSSQDRFNQSQNLQNQYSHRRKGSNEISMSSQLLSNQNNSNSNQNSILQPLFNPNKNVIGGRDENKSKTARIIQTSQQKGGRKLLNSQSFIGNRTGKSSETKAGKYKASILERDESTKHRNIKFYENLIRLDKPQSKKHERNKSQEYQTNKDILNVIEDQGEFFYLGKDVQQVLEKQLVRLKKFQVDFSISKNLIGKSIAKFFKIQDKDISKDYLSDSSNDSWDSATKKKAKVKILEIRQQKFEMLRKQAEGLTYPLQSYTKDIMRGTLSMKQEEELKKRTGLSEFLGELNDCQKNLLRMMSDISPNNCMAIYALDYLWKIMLIRFEYHLDDEEQRIQKIQKYYEGQAKREIQEVKYSIQSKEEHYKDVIEKLEMVKEMQNSRIEKLMQDKGELLDGLRDKEDEIQLLRNPHGVSKFVNLNTELEAYIQTMNDQRKEQTVALKGLKVAMDTLTDQQQNNNMLMNSQYLMVPSSHQLTFSQQTQQMQAQTQALKSNNQSQLVRQQSIKAQNSQKAIEESESSSEEEQQQQHTMKKVTLDFKEDKIKRQRSNKDLQDVLSREAKSREGVKTNINGSFDNQHSVNEDNNQVKDQSHEMALVKLNKSKALPSYRALDEGYLAPQIAQSQSAAFKNQAKKNAILYHLISQQQVQSIKRSKDQQIQTDYDQDFICSDCLIRANKEEVGRYFDHDSDISSSEPEAKRKGSGGKNTKTQKSRNNKITSFKSSIKKDSMSLSQQQQNQDSSIRAFDESDGKNNDDSRNEGNKKSSPDPERRKIRRLNTKRKEELMKLTKIVEQQHQKSRVIQIQQSNSINRSQIFNPNSSLNSRYQNKSPSSKLTISDQLNPDSKEIIIMPEQTLIKQVEELLEKKFENDEKLVQMIKVQQQQQQNPSPYQVNYGPNGYNNQALALYQSSNSQQDILQFAFTHFLTMQGLKSLAIRYLNSLYSGLRKIYLKNPQDNQYAQFLMQVFGFDPQQFPALRPDQTRVALKIRHLFQIVQRQQGQRSFKQAQTRLTNGGQVLFLEFIPFFFKACRTLAKGVFANFINKMELLDLSYKDGLTSQQIQRYFIQMKIFLLISYSKIDMNNLTLKTEAREVQMDVILMHLEEALDIKLQKQEVNIFKKEFDNFFLVPIKQLESRIQSFTSLGAAINSNNPEFQISLVVLMNRILEEWEIYQSSQRKKLLKKFIDFDENGDGVLTLDEFKELMKSLEGSAVSHERVILLFREAVELSNEMEQMRIQNEDIDDFTGNNVMSQGLSDKISPECFVDTVVKHRLGGYGNEFIDFEYLQQQLQQQYQQQSQQLDLNQHRQAQ